MSKKRARIAEEGSENGGSATIKKKPRVATRGRALAIKEEDGGGVEDFAALKTSEVVPKKRSRVIKTEGSDGSEPQTFSTNSKAPIKKASKKAAVTSGADDDLEHGSRRKAGKPKPGKPKPHGAVDKLDSSPEAPPPKGTRSRRTALKLEGEPIVVKQEESAANNDEEIVEEQLVRKEATKKRGRKKAATKSTTS